MTAGETDSGGGTSYHYGDSVTVNGSHNIGIVKNESPTIAQQAPPTLEGEIEALRQMLLVLRSQVEPASVRSIDRSLPAIAIASADSAEGSAAATAADGTFEERRHGALMAVLGIATAAREIGVPVVAAVHAVLGMLGGG
ncbi:hypothetical protein [Streptomyces sp. NBC_00454]|uniref:hypothetical protein n=1 Tax=Streptomyces sp. NBC_00454 TaxID=2975747 RepID=UPI0032482048